AFMDTLRLLRERLWIVALITIVCGITGAAMTLLQAPVYQSKLSLEIQAPAENGLGGRGALAGENPVINVQTQVKVLESVSLRRRVIQSLRAKNQLIS